MSAAVQPTPEGAQEQHTHNRDFVLQKYLLLSEQHDSLLQHLDAIRPSTAGSSSPATSPTRSSSATFPRSHSRSSSSRRGSSAMSLRGGGGMSASPFGLETVTDETTLHEVASEEAKLSGVNEGIKRALTELLNCEAVRADKPLRTWVQCRLMETERELRCGRRRRSAPGMEH